MRKIHLEYLKQYCIKHNLYFQHAKTGDLIELHGDPAEIIIIEDGKPFYDHESIDTTNTKLPLKKDKK